MACHDLPSESTGSPPDEKFDPRNVKWEETSLPAALIGDWYADGKPELSFAGDTMWVRTFLFSIATVSQSDSIYRIIYHVESSYRALYLRNLTSTQIQTAYTDSTASDLQGAAALSVNSFWLTLNTYNHWAARIMPGELAGNWHVADGELELAISAEEVSIDGLVWKVDSVTTNQIIDRLVLNSSQNYQTLFYRDFDRYTMEVLLAAGKKDFLAEEEALQGDWKKLSRWWNFAESLPLEEGMRWSYEYELDESYIQANWDSIPPDSSYLKNSLKGRLEIQVLSAAWGEYTGQATVQSTFSIDEEQGKYLHFHKEGTTELVTDSAWSNTFVLARADHEITLENDSLWFQTAGGKVLFASNKLQQGREVNLRPFVYPFEFPRDGFPNGPNATFKIAFSGTMSENPGLERSGAISHSYTLGLGETITVMKGFAVSKYAFFEIGKGFYKVMYFHGAYDVGIWAGWLSRNPYKNEAKFNCN
ncbi:MAG: hypothetical protein FVQ81_03920 [Candidatus Glassbacteria bacterium]|nr:hypothetical protein [Candidatus Glassbacteria bacterium]